MKHLVGYTKNNIPVYIDLIRSAAAKHIAQQPSLLALTAEVLRHKSLSGSNLNIEHDMGRDIGYDFVVQTNATDNVFYAQLIKENTFTRFVKKGDPLSTTYLSLILERVSGDTSYSLCGVWIGRQSPPRPGEAKEADDSKPYWDNHAFIFDNQPIQPRTITKERPY